MKGNRMARMPLRQAGGQGGGAGWAPSAAGKAQRRPVDASAGLPPAKQPPWLGLASFACSALPC